MLKGFFPLICAALIVLSPPAVRSAAPVAAAVSPLPLLTASPAAESTAAASERGATPSATVNPIARQIIQDKKDQDITDLTGGKTDTLAAALLAKSNEPLSWNNFLQVWIRQAVNNGLPSNLIVLLILFPMVAAFIAFSRHVIGLRGFGIYTPAVLSIAFLSTGIEGIPLDIAMFIFIVIITVLFGKFLKRANLAHLPKSSLILWGVCLSVIFLLIIMSYLDVRTFYSLAFFPLLILISLSENFTSTQLLTTTKEAAKLTFETLLIAVISSLIIGADLVQVFVILNPELCLLTIFIFNWLIGRYNGLRLTELFRFKALVRKD